MASYRRTRAFAIDVEIADMELTDRALNLVTRAGIHSTSEAKFGVIRDLKRMVVVFGLDDRQHGPKDFFLLQLRFWRNVSNDRRLNEISFTSIRGASAAGDHPSVFLTLLDVAHDRLHRAFVNYRAYVGVFGGISNVDFFYASLQFLQELVVNAFINNRSRASRALLALEAESRNSHALNG